MKIIKSIVPLMLSLALLSGCQSSSPSSSTRPTHTSKPTSEPTSQPTSKPSSSSTTSVAPTSDPTSASTSDSSKERESASHSFTPAQPLDPTIDSLRLSRLSLGLGVKETYQLEVQKLPRQEVYPTITFESSDSSVASVDASGLVTANGKGMCEIVAKWGEVTSPACSVYVGESISRSQLKNIANGIIEEHNKGDFPVISKVRADANWKNTYSKNDVPQHMSKFFRRTIVSVEDAYLYMEDHDTTIKVEDGAESYTNDAWVIYTTESYNTFLFHIDGDTKTYMIADSTSFISQGKSRFDAMCSILDTLFTAGSGLVTGYLEDIYGDGSGLNALTAFNYSDVTIGRRFSSGADSLIYSCSAKDKDTAGQEEESEYYIPGGTTYDFSISHDYVVANNLVKSDSLSQGMEWYQGEDKYSNVYDIEYEYDADNVELFYPDRAEYAKVDTIFDL